jgi:hypothetical protein
MTEKHRHGHRRESTIKIDFRGQGVWGMWADGSGNKPIFQFYGSSNGNSRFVQ